MKYTVRRNIAISKTLDDLIQKVADSIGLPVPEYIRYVLLRACENFNPSTGSNSPLEAPKEAKPAKGEDKDFLSLRGSVARHRTGGDGYPIKSAGPFVLKVCKPDRGK